MFKPTSSETAAARLAATPTAGARLGYSRLGMVYFTTGRMCSSSACDPFAESTFGDSDISLAGDGVAFYFAFSKSLAWLFAIASLFAIPQAVINAGGALQGAWGLAALSQTMLGNLGAAGAVVDVVTSVMTNSTAVVVVVAKGKFSAAAAAAIAAVGQRSIPGLYAALDFGAILVISLGIFWILRFARARERAAETDALGAEDYTIMVAGLRRGALSACAAGDCSCGATPLHPEALVEHFESIARTFTSDWRVARVGGAAGRSEVFFAGAELRAAPLFRRRASLIAALHERQVDLAALEKRVGLVPASRWTRKAPGFARIAGELRQLVGDRARAAKVATDLETLWEEAHHEAERERCISLTNDDIYGKGDSEDEDDDEDGGERGREREWERDRDRGGENKRLEKKEMVVMSSTGPLARFSRAHSVDSAATAELIDETERRGVATATTMATVTSPTTVDDTAALSPMTRMTAPEMRRTRQRSDRLLDSLSPNGGGGGGGGVQRPVESRDGDEKEKGQGDAGSRAGAGAGAGAGSNAGATLPNEGEVERFDDGRATLTPSQRNGSERLLFGGTRRQRQRQRMASSSDVVAGGHSILQNVSATSRAYANARYSDDESSGSLSTVRTNDGDVDEPRDDATTTEEEEENEDKDDADSRFSRRSNGAGDAAAAASPSGNWWPGWLGGSSGGLVIAGGEATQITPPPHGTLARVTSGRSRPRSAHTGLGGTAGAGASGDGPFSAAVQLHVTRVRARERNSEMEKGGGMGSRSRPLQRLSAASIAMQSFLSPTYREQLTIHRYTRKSPRPCCGLCGDRPPLDILDAPLGSYLSGERAVALAKRIAWLRGRIDDLLYDIDAATRVATKFVPDADVLADMGMVGDAARRAAAAEAASATSPGAMRDAKRLAETAAIGVDAYSADKRVIATEDPVVAFITFESAQTAKAVIRLFSMGKVEWCLRGGAGTVGPPAPGGRPKWFAADAATSNLASAAAKKANGAVFARGRKGGDADPDADAEEGGKGRDFDNDINVPLAFWGLQLHVTRAPPADTLIWENLHTGPVKRAAMNCCVSLAAASLCIFSFALLYGSQVFQSASVMLDSGNATYCAAVAGASWVSYARPDTDVGSAAIAANATAAAAEYFLLSADAAIGVGLLRPPALPQDGRDDLWWALGAPAGLVSFNFSTLVGSAAAANISLPTPAAPSSFSINTLTGVDCGVRAASNNGGSGTFLPWDRAVNITCGAMGSLWGNASFANYTLSPALALAASLRVPVLFPANEGTRACKCALAFVRSPGALVPPGLSLSSFTPSEVLLLAQRWAQNAVPGSAPRSEPDWVVCYPWVLAYVSYAIIVCVAAVAAIVVNAAMAALLNVMKSCEAHTTTDRARSAHLIRAVLLQSFNTALLVLLVSAYVPALPLDTPGAKYADFSNAWYANKGPTLIIAVIASGVGGPAARLLFACAWRLRRHPCVGGLWCPLSARGPGDLAAKLSPPVFDYSDRYAETITLASVTLVYSTGIPVLIPLAALFIALGGAVDRALFLLHYAAPPIEDASTGALAVALLPIALLLHALVGAWMMSTPGLTAMAAGQVTSAADASITATRVTFTSTTAFAQEVALRAAQVWVAPLLVEAAIWSAWIVFAIAVAFFVDPLTSAATGTWRACRCGKRGRTNDTPPPGAAEGPKALAATDISRTGDFAFLAPMLKWLPRVAAARDARGEAPPSADALEAALRADSADVAAVVGASKKEFFSFFATVSDSDSAPPSENKAQRVARRLAATTAAAAAKAAAEDAAAERASRRAACIKCTLRSATCICVAIADGAAWIFYWFCQRPKVRAAAAARAAELVKLAASAARRERKRARAAARAAKGKSPKRARRKAAAEGDGDNGGGDDDEDGDGHVPFVVEDVPPPPCHVYCCGGRIRVGGACCAGGCYGLCRAVGGVPVFSLPPGALNESARAALLPPPPFASALSLRLLRGAVSYSPLASQPLLRGMLPELWHARAELPATHVTIARAAVFGYATLMAKPTGAPGETGGVHAEEAEPWDEREDALFEGLPEDARRTAKAEAKTKARGGLSNPGARRRQYEEEESSDEDTTTSDESDSESSEDSSAPPPKPMKKRIMGRH